MSTQSTSLILSTDTASVLEQKQWQQVLQPPNAVWAKP